MEIKTTAVEMPKDKWVITKDGIRMAYKEYREMIESERY